MSAQEHIDKAAEAAHQLLGYRAAQIDHWAAARGAGASYVAISRGVALALAARGHTPEEIDATGTGPDNIRKLLRRRGR